MLESATKAVSWEKRGDIAFVRFKADKITEIPFANQAAKELGMLAERIGGKTVLNLSNVKFMASCGISLVVNLNRNLRSRGGQMKVCGVSPLLVGIFRTTGLDGVFEIHSTEAEAVASFRKAPSPAGGTGVSQNHNASAGPGS